MKQNITLSLDKELIKKAKILAAQRQVSVTRLLSQELQRIVEDEEAYEFAKKVAFEELEKGINSGGTVTWSREDLHAR